MTEKGTICRTPEKKNSDISFLFFFFFAAVRFPCGEAAQMPRGSDQAKASHPWHVQRKRNAEEASPSTNFLPPLALAARRAPRDRPRCGWAAPSATQAARSMTGISRAAPGVLRNGAFVSVSFRGKNRGGRFSAGRSVRAGILGFNVEDI